VSLEVGLVERGEELAEREVAGAAEDGEVAALGHHGDAGRGRSEGGRLGHDSNGDRNLGSLQALLGYFDVKSSL
jgi:hypothetical protein